MSDYDSCDWDGPSVYGEKEVVARKEHRCVECSAPILKSEKHLRYSGRWDGNWDSGRQHLLCRDACVWVRDQLEDRCLAFGELREWWSDRRSSSDVMNFPRRAIDPPHEIMKKRWLLGAKMYAMICRREREARA